MGRLLFWLILGFLFWFVVRLLLSRRDGSAQSDASEKGTGTGAGTGTGKGDSGAKTAQIPMLQCAYCGVHFSSVDAVTSEDGRVYCTSAHHALAHR